MAEDLLDRFFRDAEGKSNRQIDVYYALQDMGVPRERADEGLEYLTSRGLLNLFGPDIAFLTDLGVAAILEEKNIANMQKASRDFGAAKSAQPAAAATAKPSKAPEPAPPSGGAPPPSAVPLLDFLDADGEEHSFELVSVVGIGRAEGNTLQLNDQRASKKHAEIKWDGKGFVLQDLGAANGTLVNGEYVERHPLKHGDEIVIGRTALIFRTPPAGGVPRDLARPEPSRSEPRAERAEPPRADPPRAAREMAAQSSPQVTGIKVVKGRPDQQQQLAAPQAPQRPAREPITAQSGEYERDDLFADRREPAIPPFGRSGPTPVEDPNDLFAETVRPERSGRDLFDGSAPSRRAQDLFADDGPRGAADAGDDLFEEPQLPDRPGREPVEDLFEEDPNAATRVRSRNDLDALPIEPIESLEEVQPLDPLGTGDLQEIAATPTYALNAVEPLGLDDPEAELPRTVIAQGQTTDSLSAERPWEERTPADPRLAEPLLSNVPVRDMMAPEGDANTVTVSRRDLFGDVPDALAQASTDAGAEPREEREEDLPELPLEELEPELPPSALTYEDQDQPAEITGVETDELPRWGDEAPPQGSHPAYGSAGAMVQVSGEELPDADPSLAELSLGGPIQAPSTRPETPFHRTLRQIRMHVERANLPDREELLQALELLEHHPYIRVALNVSEPDR